MRKILCSGKFPGLVLRLLDPCGICHFRKAPPGHYFNCYLFPSFYSIFLSPLGVALTSLSTFPLLFLFSNAQVINSIGYWVYDHYDLSLFVDCRCFDREFYCS